MSQDNNSKSNTNKTSPKVFLAVITAHIFWGFSFLAARRALEVTNMFVLLSHRFIIATLAMSLVVLFGFAKINLKGKRIHLLIALAILQPVIYFLGEQYGIQHSTTIFSGVMIALIPIFGTLAAAPILKEKPTHVQLFFSALSVSGVIGIGLMSKNSGALELGGVIALIIAVSAAAGYLMLARNTCTEFTAFERTYSMMFVSAIVFSILAIFSVKGDMQAYISPVLDTKYLISILFLSLCCSVASFGFDSYAIQHLTVAKLSAFANLTTAVSVFAGVVFLHEPFSFLGFIFCVMILVGIYGVQKSGTDS